MSQSSKEELADAHWEYIEKLLLTHGVHYETIKLVRFHYKSAFIHGFKHGLEEQW